MSSLAQASLSLRKEVRLKVVIREFLMNRLLKKVTQFTVSFALMGLSYQTIAQTEIDLENEDNRIAYALGVNIGQNLASQGMLDNVDLKTFFAGMLDAVTGEPKLSDEEMFAAIQTFQQRVEEEAQAAVSGNLAESSEFLSINSTKEGVVTLESGLQYLVLESGEDDAASPTAEDAVLAHYHGTLSDGTVFDSSVDRGEPAQFGLNQVISGWTEALQLMKIGDKWRLFLPPNLAYGEASPTPAIPPNSALIFDVELLEIR
jgi:FKBP-type peptidyl-prolyl cis-trans isomerase